MHEAHRTVERWHHVTRHEFPRTHACLTVGPIVGEAEDHTEAAGDLLQMLDRGDEIVGCADDRSARAGSAATGDFFEQLPLVFNVEGARATEHVHVVFVVPTLQAIDRFVASLFA